MNTNRLLLAIAALCWVVPPISSAHDDPAKTVSALTQHISEEPDNADLYVRRGDLYRANKNWPKALADFLKATELLDDSSALDGAIGESLLGTGQAQEALPYLNRYLQREPRNASILEVRGKTHTALGNNAAAATDFQAAIKYTTKPQPDIYLKLAAAQTAEQKYDAALATIESGVNKLGPAISLLDAAIDIEIRQGDYDAALKRIDTLPGKLRETPKWLIRKGDIFRLDQQEAAALQSYQQAQIRFEALPEIRRNLPSGQEIAVQLAQRLPNS